MNTDEQERLRKEERQELHFVRLYTPQPTHYGEVLVPSHGYVDVVDPQNPARYRISNVFENPIWSPESDVDEFVNDICGSLYDRIAEATLEVLNWDSDRPPYDARVQHPKPRDYPRRKTVFTIFTRVNQDEQGRLSLKALVSINKDRPEYSVDGGYFDPVFESGVFDDLSSLLDERRKVLLDAISRMQSFIPEFT